MSFRPTILLFALFFTLVSSQRTAAMLVEIKTPEQVVEGQLELSSPKLAPTLFGPLIGPLYSLFGGDFYYEATRPNGVKRLTYPSDGVPRSVKLDAFQIEWILYLLGHLDRRNLWLVPVAQDLWRVGTIAKLHFILDANGGLKDISCYLDFDPAAGNWSLHPSRTLRRLVAKSQQWREINEEARTLGFESAIGLGSDTPLVVEAKQHLVPIRILKINGSGSAWVATEKQWSSLFTKRHNHLTVFEIPGRHLLVTDKYNIRRMFFNEDDRMAEETLLLKDQFPHRESDSVLEDVFTPTPFWSDLRKAFRSRSGLLKSDSIHCGNAIELFYN